MRNVVLAMMTTANGRVDDPDAWMTDLGVDLYRDMDNRYEGFDTVLVGRTTYAEMAAYWPNAQIEDAPLGGLRDAPNVAGEHADINRRMAHKMNSYRKLVFSRGGVHEPLAWTYSELVVTPTDADLVHFVAELETQPGRNIHLSGGAQLAQTFARLGLVDEHYLYVHPVASRGATVFDGVDGRCGLELVDTTRRMPEELLHSATSPELGDEAAFTALVERYRRQLLVHCYRMLGSFEEAEDLVQETFVRAWRGRAGFEGRSQVRTWLYRIATNVCLTALARRPRRVMPPDLSASTIEPPSDADADADIPWLQPFPDQLLERVESSEPEPDAAVVARETIELAYVAAIQHLPPRPRAVLILRDALDRSARETAEVLDMTVTAVNSALPRARATLRARVPAQPGDAPPVDHPTMDERAVLERYMAAHDQRDESALAALLREDVRLVMPPHRGWYSGRATVMQMAVLGFDPAFGHLCGVATSANRQPAVAWYLRGPDDAEHRALALDVLRIERGLIVDITSFAAPQILAMFGLPPTLGQ